MTVRLLAALVAAFALAAPAPAGAIVNGSPDGDDHPYVAIVGAGDAFCSASLVTPTVLVTAGHCTDAFEFIGGPVYATFDEHARPDSTYVHGTAHTMPGFYNLPPQGTGLPASVSHDIGVVVLDAPVDVGRLAQLPPAGLLDGRVTGLPLTYVGYGGDGWHTGGGPPFPTFSFDRLAGFARALAVAPAGDGEFLMASTARGKNWAGPGPGDSGGPALLWGTDVVAAIGSHGASRQGTGDGYLARLDTEAALEFITQFTE
jgi:trypsin